MITTELIHLDVLGKEEREQAIYRAGELIRQGQLVAFPTETVYGLGADAMDEEAAARIYAAKGRPSDNPLIVHIADRDQVRELAAEVPQAAVRLMERFWPGPLTLIFHKKPEVPDGTTGGLPTVAVRMPSHPAARDLIRVSRRMIAAPSANRSGRPSPTMASHVYQDLKGRVPMILDGGPVEIGIESTIVDMTVPVPMILRPGLITEEMIREEIGEIVTDPAVKGRKPDEHVTAKAPGMKYRHYAPSGQMVLVEGPAQAVTDTINRYVRLRTEQGYKTGVIAAEETAAGYDAHVVRTIGSREHPETVAAGLYRILREMDDLACDYIYSESFFEISLADAVMNRMLKAAGYQLISLK